LREIAGKLAIKLILLYFIGLTAHRECGAKGQESRQKTASNTDMPVVSRDRGDSVCGFPVLSPGL
jgi:hypothetical protein